jgi:two-component sensor histidine kinase/ABC-type amino acid transport substrate-binding protein
MSPVFPPLKFSEKGVIKGIEPDYLDLLSEYTGIQFEYVICDFALMDAKVKSGEIDMFLSFIIPERLGYMTFTEPFMEFKQVIVARSDAPFMSGIGALKGKKMATVKGVRLYDKLLGPYPEIETVPVQTMEEMFKVVAESKADALISKTFYAGYVINNYPNLKIAGIADLPPEPYLYAVRKDYPELVGILNKAIAFIPKDRVDSTIQKWFSIRLEYRANWSEILKWALVIAGAFAFILGLSFLWNRRLAREVDKRRQAEEILRGSQSLLNEMGKLAKIGGWEFDVETQEQEWTDEVYRIHEVDMTYKPTVSKGIDFYAPTSRPIIEKVVQRAVEQGEPFDVELELITAKGNPRWVHAIGRAHREGGKTSKVFGFLQDVTERRRAEEALRRQSDFLRSVIDSLGHPFYVIDVGDYSIKLVNKFASVTLPEAITCHALTHGRDKPCHGPEHNCPIEEVKRTGQPAVVEHVHRDAAGHERHLEIQAHPVFDNQGNVVQLIEYAVDITDRKRAEEKVHASLREKELLLGEIHHRVKNNLQIIVSLLNMQSRQPGHEDLEVLFQETRDRIRAMASVHALLYRSQNFAGIDFGEYIRETAGYLLRAYKKSTARISLIIHAENVTLSIDQAIPCGLITNELITNALKHAFPEAAEGELEIGMAETGEGIRLTVKDNGVGFPPDMDFRNSETMGLRLVNMLVKQLGGAIEQVMDGGTTYSIVFRPRPIALEVQHAGQSHHDCGR